MATSTTALKAIKVTKENEAAINSALKTANGKATGHTYTEYSSIAKMEDEATYSVTTAPAVSSDDAIIAKALAILDSRMRKPGQAFNCPDDVKAYCCLNIGNLPHEVFGVLFLDAKHRLLAYDEMFRGTITQASVYPREVVKAAIAHNSVAVVLTHNHPSGSTDPSRADTALTQTLKSALAMIDVKVLDHVIVSGGQSLSMAERGLV